jgi:RNA polymerase sigma-70 factor (ECF subfamily)
MDKTSPDPQLTEAICSSDAAAFKILFYRYYEQLYYFLCQRIHSSDLARDFVQEVFTRVWQTRERLDSKQSIKAYLYRIANNLVIDHLRKRVSQVQYQREHYHKTASQEGVWDTKLSVQDAVSRLPVKLLTVFILSRHQGLTYNEIAEACQISVKTVESRMSQAFRLLREFLE